MCLVCDDEKIILLNYISSYATVHTLYTPMQTHTYTLYAHTTDPQLEDDMTMHGVECLCLCVFVYVGANQSVCVFELGCVLLSPSLRVKAVLFNLL